jgi:hypothetical protein
MGLHAQRSAARMARVYVMFILYFVVLSSKGLLSSLD